MCGICGEIVLDQPGAGDVFPAGARVAALRHRGPDDEGAYGRPGLALGACRLSIIDLAGGRQPVWNEDRTCCIVFNGELYNFRDLRAELEARGHAFRTASDTEVVLHAYEEWGAQCLRRFNGMFAFAVWQEPRRVLFLARDRVGEKPLYYYRDSRRLVFASEIKAILADRSVPREVSPKGLANFLAFGHAVAPDTIYRGVFKLLPGHYLLVRGGDVRTVRYWDVGQDPPLPAGKVLGPGAYARQVRALLDDSVRRRLVADVPVGAFLSGGLDSSAVVALMRRHAGGPVKTFSLGFRIGGAYNELGDARRVARHLGTEHYEVEADDADLLGTLRTLVYHYDEPFGDAAGFPLYLLSRFARGHVKVVLCGDGGDELFGGYRRYAVDALAGRYQLLPRALTGGVLPWLARRLPGARRLKRAVRTLPIRDPARRYASWLVLFDRDMRGELLADAARAGLADYDPAWPYPRFYAGLNGSTAADHLNRLMYVDLKTWLADTYLEKTDKATMACGLEARLPLLDHRLVELAFQIPGRYKVRGRSGKVVLKQAVRDLLPPEVVGKPKRGFAVPTGPWLRGSLGPFAREILFDARARRRGYFHTPAVERLWREHAAGRHDWGEHLWLLLNFELWHRIYLDGEAV
jgi:asparagine synthase (glutamine-hydrolysing)